MVCRGFQGKSRNGRVRRPLRRGGMTAWLAGRLQQAQCMKQVRNCGKASAILPMKPFAAAQLRRRNGALPTSGQTTEIPLTPALSQREREMLRRAAGASLAAKSLANFRPFELSK